MRRATAFPGRPRPRDTRTLVISLLLLVALLLAALVGYSAFRDVQAKRALVQHDAVEYSREAAFEIDAFLSSTERMLEALAASPAVRDQQPDVAMAALAALLKANPEYANIWATDADGWSWANPLPNPDGTPTYVGDRRYFQDAMETARLSIQAVPDNRQHPTRFGVVLCIPVPGADGKPNGTVQASFELLPVQLLLGNVALPPDSSVTVLDEAANVVARYPSREEWVGRNAESTQVWQAIQGQASGTLEGEFLGGEKRLVGYTATSLAPWKVVVGFPLDAAYTGLREEMLSQLLMLAIPCAIVAFISWRLGFLALNKAEHYQTLFDSMEEGFGICRLTCDESGKPSDLVLLDINPGAERILGSPREKLVGRTIREMIPGIESRWLEVLGPVAKTGEAIRYESFVQDLGRWFRVHAFSPDRGLVAAIFADVTDMKKAEAERERLLAAEQEARAQAERAVKVRDEFMSCAAHELKTPVTALRGYAQLLARQLKQTGALDPERVARALWHMDQQSGRLKLLSEQLLDVSRLDSGKLALSPSETNLAALAAGVVEAARHAHPERTLLFQDGTGSTTPSALVDGLRLEQVLSSLLDNAVKFSPKNTPIEVRVRAGDPGSVEISVRDHGDGVPEGERERIFDRFYQAHNERCIGGMGIGLFMSRQVVEMHGGTIRCEDAEGGGSRFVICLPAVHPRPETEAGGGGN